MDAIAAVTPPPSGLRTDIVIPVHNRREVTLRCLARLRELGVLNWAGAIVVDDGSTDGTGEALRAQYPEAVVLTGNGNLWWGGSTELGMAHAMKRGADLIYWLNDDCLVRAGTLELLARRAVEMQGAATAQSFTPSGLRYGAFRRTGSGLEAVLAQPGETLACDTFNGNCVCFPRAVVERVGLADGRRLPHNFSDTDYGLRIRRAGLPVEVLGDAACDNEDNLNVISRSWLLSPVPLRRILASFFSPKSSLYVPALFVYQWRHWGVKGVSLFLVPYLKFLLTAVARLLVPRRWLLAWFGPRSESWQRENFHGA